MRLYEPATSADDVACRGRYAVELGLAAVICRPEHVAAAAKSVHGSQVGVCTALDFTHRTPALPDPGTLAEEAFCLAGAGATSIAIVVTSARLQDDRFGHALDAITRGAGRADATSRALIDIQDMTLEQAVAAAVLARNAGASEVQVGSFTNARASFTLLREFRSALGPDVRLKWTRPVRSIDALLLGVAEGADLFNADIDLLLAEATHRQSWLPLSVPLSGHDY
jgi:deoxyribose-phosphate aldolase